MRNWLGASAVVTLAYIAFLVSVAVKDGKLIKHYIFLSLVKTIALN